MAGLRNQVKELQISAKKKRQADLDPEDDPFSKQADSESGTDSDISIDEQVGKEHYEAVGKSKLRKQEKPKLDQIKYGGQAVSRDDIFQDDGEADVLVPDEDEDEDPFAVAKLDDKNDTGSEDQDMDSDLPNGDDVDAEIDEEDEIDSDDAFDSGEEDRFRSKGFVFRGSGKDLKALPVEGSDDDSNDEEEEEDDGSEQDEINVDMDGTDSDNDDQTEDEDMDSQDDEESTARPRPSSLRAVGSTDREKLKALMSSDTAALASSLSASLSADAQKGAAVKTQYQTFDRLLDARIKIQKGLTATENLGDTSEITDDEAQAALRKAEEAALKLYSTIESLRHSILETTSSTSNGTSEVQRTRKRKTTPPPTQSTSTQDLWSRIESLETKALPTRRQTLDKWSLKTRSATFPPSNSTSKLTNSSSLQSKLTTVLDAYLATETPKTLQTQQPLLTYDDSTFYQSLLRDLINSRAATTSSLSTQQSTIPIVPLKLHPSGNTSKQRRVDTKASKGRKIRYTVHEKLENFMASEGRGNAVGQWNDGAVREFFASLLGQRGMLGEDDEAGDGVNGNVNGDAEDSDREVEALKLFRT